MVTPIAQADNWNEPPGTSVPFRLSRMSSSPSPPPSIAHEGTRGSRHEIGVPVAVEVSSSERERTERNGDVDAIARTRRR